MIFYQKKKSGANLYRMCKSYSNARLIVSLTVALCMLMQNGMGMIVYALSPLGPQKPIEKLRVVDNGIGYDYYDKNYVDVTWEYPAGFFVPGAVNTYLDFFAEEVPKPYFQSSGGRVAKDREIMVNPSITTHRFKNLKPGTIYYFDAIAYYRYLVNPEGTITQNSDSSQPSNRVKVMTDITIEAKPVGANQIKIEWDDVWNQNGRISYELYVSDSASFANTSPIFIDPSDIGPGKPVKENVATGRLEYIYNAKEPGRIYYAKIVPRILDADLRYYSPQTKTVSASTYILAQTTKLSSSVDQVLWRLDWTPVVLGLSDSDVKIQYEVFKGKIGSSDYPVRLQKVSTTSMLLVLSPGEEATSYFKIRAELTRNGLPAYPDVRIESDIILLKDSEIAANPPAPVLVDEIGGVQTKVQADSVTLLWKLPKKPSGEVDFDIIYDVWLVTDPNKLTSPESLDKPVSWSISSGRVQTIDGGSAYIFDHVKTGSNIVGCRLDIQGINPNTTYYFRIVARKGYMVLEGDVLKLKYYSSQPAVKVLITPTAGDMSRPVAPSKPPFRIKKDKNGSDVITDTSVTLQIDNRWYEVNLDPQNGTIWQYVNTRKNSASDELPEDSNFDESVIRMITDPIQDVNRNNVKLVKYDEQITIDVYYEKYDPQKTYDDLDDPQKHSPKKAGGFTVVANDPDENILLNYPDYKFKRNVNLLLQGLEPNTTYVVWVRAVRAGTGLVSDPSDPIIVTTLPTDSFPLEKPTVPVFNYHFASDNYIDIGWDYNPKYKYNIRYGKTEDFNSSKLISNIDLAGKNYFRVEGLEKSTTYYFWIQAEYTNQIGQNAKSDWSDSYAVTTLHDQPPETPLGFGVKTHPDAVGKNHITYEWIKQDGLEYILEISTSIDYKNAVQHTVGKVSEYKADKLISNQRYYARLYAYDPQKKLKSAPTQSIAVKTLRSNDDYDSDQDNDSVLDGPYIKKDPFAIENTWNITITGIDAERFIQKIKTDDETDYIIDVSNPPYGTKKIRILIASRVFEALNDIKENIVIKTPVNLYVIRPGVLDAGNFAMQKRKYGDFNFEFAIGLPNSQNWPASKEISHKIQPSSLALNIYGGTSSYSLQTTARTIKTVYTYEDESWYKYGKTYAHMYDSSLKNWVRIDTKAYYDSDAQKGFVTFETNKTGIFTVADVAALPYDDVKGHWAYKSIYAVASAKRLNSIKGNKLQPDKNITVAQAVKLVFDIMEQPAGNDFMNTAYKAGFITQADLLKPNANITREQLIYMGMRMVELKTKSKASISQNISMPYRDSSSIGPLYLQRVRYAYSKGMIISRFSNILGPKDNITMAQFMVFMEKILIYCGEI